VTSARYISPRIAALAAMTAAVYLIEVAVVQRLAVRIPARELTAVVMFDLVVAVPLAWWVFVLRHAPGSGRRVLPIVLASLAGAALVVPADGRTMVSYARVAVVPIELIALVAAVRTIARAASTARTSADLAERIDEALTRALGDHIAAHLVAAKATAVAYAMLGARRGAVARVAMTSMKSPAAGALFTLETARAPALTWGLSLVTLIESLVVHALPGAAHPVVAWTTSAIGGYAVLWLVGQDRATSARAISIEPDHLVLHAGLRLTARVAWSLVASAEVVSWDARPARASGYLDATRPVDPNIVIGFRAPVVITGAFGVRRSVRRVGLCVDDPEGLRAAIDAAVAARAGRAGAEIGGAGAVRATSASLLTRGGRRVG